MTKAKKVEESQLSMKVPTTCWKKVGILAAIQSEDKKVIVEKAIDFYYEKHGIGAVK